VPRQAMGVVDLHERQRLALVAQRGALGIHGDNSNVAGAIRDDMGEEIEVAPCRAGTMHAAHVRAQERLGLEGLRAPAAKRHWS
jgi:hypothetical protein